MPPMLWLIANRLNLANRMHHSNDDDEDRIVQFYGDTKKLNEDKFKNVQILASLPKR